MKDKSCNTRDYEQGGFMRLGKCCSSNKNHVEGLQAKIPSYEDVKGQAEFLKAIADPTRIRILYALTGGDLCVCEIMGLIGASQTLVSHHCKILKVAGIITDHKSGKWVNYSLVDQWVIEMLIALKHGDK
jgi:ArsR family transcriptional regulator